MGIARCSSSSSTDPRKDWEESPMLKLGLQSYFLDIPVDDKAVPHCIWAENGFVDTNSASPKGCERSRSLLRG